MIEGSCLCGSVTWQLDGQPDGATACNCTACRGTELYGRMAMSMKTSGRKVKHVPMFVTMPYWNFTSAPSADAWHFGVG